MDAVLEDLGGLDESLHEHYEQRDGKYVLKVDGELPGYVKASQLAETKTKLSEMRETNIGLLKGVAELAGVDEASDLSPLREKLKSYEGIDPEDYRKLKAELDKKGVKKGDDIDGLIQSQMEKFKEEAIAPLKQQLEQEREARVAAQKRADQSTLREKLSAALGDGVKTKALPFLLDKASVEFTVKDGEVAVRDGRLSPKTAEPWTLDGWVEHARSEYDFAFKSSTGGGANPGPGGPPQAPPTKLRGSDGEELKTDGITVLAS